MRTLISKVLLVALACTATASLTASPAVAGSEPPDRIVSISPTATEMLFAIGAGEQVVAVDDQSELPGGGSDDRPLAARAQRRGDRRLRA